MSSAYGLYTMFYAHFAGCKILLLIPEMPGVEHINPSLISQVVVPTSKHLVLNYPCLAIYCLMA